MYIDNGKVTEMQVTAKEKSGAGYADNDTAYTGEWTNKNLYLDVDITSMSPIYYIEVRKKAKDETGYTTVQRIYDSNVEKIALTKKRRRLVTPV